MTAFAAAAWALLAIVTPDVQWRDASQTCPMPQSLPAALEPGSGEVRVVVDVTAVEAGWHASVQVETDAGSSTRALQSSACSTLGEAVTLIAAAALADATAEPEAGPAERPLEEEEEEEAATEETAAFPLPPAVPESEASAADGLVDTTDAEPSVLVESAAPVEAAPPSSGVRNPPAVFVRAEGAAGWGLTPLADVGGGGALGIGWRALTLEGFGLAVASTQTSDVPGVRVSGWSAGARACGQVWQSDGARLSIPLCGSVEVGRLRGVGVGDELDRREEHRDTWLGVAAGAGLRVGLSRRFALRLTTEAVVIARRPGFTISGLGEVHRARSVGPRMRLGLEIRLFGSRSSLSSTD